MEKANKFKNHDLNSDILLIIILIIEKYNIHLEESDKRSLKKLFSKLNKKNKDLQLTVLQEINTCILDE